MNKERLRSIMRERRGALSPDRQAEDAQAVLTRLRAFAPYRQARSVMAYMACRGEMSLAPVIDDVLRSGKILLLPRCEAPGEMTARMVPDVSRLVRGAYGVPEPDASCGVYAPEMIDLILVPGTAFDRQGDRLGQGGGYYDRFLRHTAAWRVGVCHDFALLDAVPADAHDQRMDAVITPGGIVPAAQSDKQIQEEHI